MRKRLKFHMTAIPFLLIDVVFVNLAAFIALILRFEFSWSVLQNNAFLRVITMAAIPATCVVIATFFAFHIYSTMWKFANEGDFVRAALSCVTASAFYMIVVLLQKESLPRSFPFLFAISLVFLICGYRLLIYLIYGLIHGRKIFPLKGHTEKKRTMLIGAGSSAAIAIKEFDTNPASHNHVVCAIDDDPEKQGRRIRGVKVIGGRDSIEEGVKKYNIEEIVFCIPSSSVKERNEILEICSNTGAKLKTLPSLSQLANGEITATQMKTVGIEDLLERPQVNANNAIASERIRDRIVLVTGGGGSIGSELCRQIAAFQPKKLIIFDIYENNAYDIQQELKRKHPELELIVLIGSVRDQQRVNTVFETYRPDIVCHAAAHKHVPLMEDSPAEAVINNVFGTYHVSKAAGEYGSKLFILISTDKAVNPTNVMGATKRLCEMVVQSMNTVYDTEYIAVRFGNVLGSNGSVIPLFKKQIASGGPVTVTDKRVTRFFMTIPEAVSLILQASAYAEGGEVFVLDMGEPVRIDDMARKMIKLSGFKPDEDIKIEYIGLRPGEKLYEELLLKTEGLEKTSNDLIYIGHQRVYSNDEILKKLEILRGIRNASNEAVRACVFDLIREDRGSVGVGGDAGIA